MRILALDIGQKRTGVAVTDPLQIICQPLETVQTHVLLEYVKKYMVAEQVELLVVGLPIDTQGKPSQTYPLVKQWIARIGKALPTLKIVEEDERYTTVIALQTIAASGLGKMARRQKGLADKVSAALILQSYLERRSLTYAPPR